LPVPAADTSPTATVLDLIAGDMVEVDRVIARRLDTGVPLVSQVSNTSSPPAASACGPRCCC
jgi:octaprenyl-diphosphate synthase